MGHEISDYTAAAVDYLSGQIGPRWPVYARSAGSLRPATETWGVEIGVVMASIDGHLDTARAELACQASIRYVGRSPQHDRYTEAMDIAITLAALLSSQRVPHEVDLGQGLVDRIPIGEAVHDVQVMTEPETAVIGGLMQPTGAYRVYIQWADSLPVVPDIVIDGTPLGHLPAPAYEIETVDLIEQIAGSDVTRTSRVADTAPGIHFGVITPRDVEALAASGAFGLHDVEVRDELAGEYRLPRIEDDDLYVPYWAYPATTEGEVSITIGNVLLRNIVTLDTETADAPYKLIYPARIRRRGIFLDRIEWIIHVTA